MTHLLADIGNVALWLSAVGIVAWIVQYSVLARWHRNPLGVSLVGMEIAMLAIYAPSLMALADPADYATFATTRWYLYLTVGIVVATAAFVVTRIAAFEWIRRQRGVGGLAANGRVAELEAEVARLRERLEARSLMAAA